MITTIPGKDLEKFIRDIRRTLKSADIVVAFRLADHGLLTLKELEYQMIADLAQFLTLILICRWYCCARMNWAMRIWNGPREYSS